MKDTTRERWLARIEEWRSSGKTAEEFAEGQPFSSGTLTCRASQLRHELGSGRKARTTREVPQDGRSGVVFAEVIRRKRSMPSGGLTVEVGSARISVSSGFDSGLLRDVVRALREAAL